MGKGSLRRFLIGKEAIPSLKLYKQAMLRGQIALMLIAVSLAYIFIDVVYAIYRNIPLYTVIGLIGAGTFWLNRKRIYREATLLVIIASNFIIYLFASSEPEASGVYIFFLPVSLAAMALFTYSDWYLGLACVLLSFALFLLAYLSDFSILTKVEEIDATDELYFLINFTVALTTSVLVVYFLLNLNYHAEKSLRENESRLVQLTEELKQSNAELDRFVYSVSHDLRAPLSSVVGLVGLAEVAENPQEVKSYLAMMRNRIDALEKFIRDIIDYSRNARLGVLKERVNLNELMQEVMDSLRFADEVSSVKIKTDISANLELVTDKIRLRIILNNLIANALKYHDKHKEERYVHVQARKHSNCFQIDVEDNGIGIKPDHLPRVFEMFYRASESSKGSGLGLYIARETIKKMGGQITVKSEFGKGTHFQIDLPHN
ncbi:MAG: HAMP domain-containing histidine kinase [Cyclobacteriaceae bacterium]|nr:HAMP domain-containing histidine kinase [Cyclobacteriaceae bacterium]UYN86665.1 MAG: HAMP domain-containing histidine kinase [Cyclobacteriaceae bacterium]